MAWTSAEDIQARWAGDNPPTNDILISYLIQDVELFIAHDFPDIDDRAEDDTDLLDRVRAVVAQVVMRLLRNPDGVTTQTLGDATIGYSANRNLLSLEPYERAQLQAPETTVQRAFTINPTPVVSPVTDLVGAWVNGPLGTEPS